LWLQNARDDFREREPVFGFGPEVFAALRCELVELRRSSAAGCPPLAGHETPFLEAVQRGIERSFLDADGVGGFVGEPASDRVPVARAGGEGLKDEEVECAAEAVARLAGQGYTQNSVYYEFYVSRAAAVKRADLRSRPILPELTDL